MRILCISDTTSSLAFSPRVRDIYGDVDLILSAGDMPLESYDYVQTMLNRDIYYVYGNHNLKDFRKAMKMDFLKPHQTPGLDNRFYGFMADGRCYRDKSTGLLIAGLGGSMLYNGGDSQYTEREMKWRIMRLVPTLLANKRKYGRYLDILITHAAPYGMGDGEDLCHRGFKAFLSFIDKFQPSIVVHGHIHLDDRNAERVIMRGKTKVINVYGAYLLEDDLGGNISGR